MLFHLLLLVLALFIVIKSANFAIVASTSLAKCLGIPKHIVGFIIIALISILPETFISITAALEGVPALGLGTLFGSNVADLTIVFAIITFFSKKGLKVEQSILFSAWLYMMIMAAPILFGFDGYYSRLEGVGLIASGLLFHVWIMRSHKHLPDLSEKKLTFSWKYPLYLLLSMAGLLLGSHLTVTEAVSLSEQVGLPPMIIGLFVIGVGATLPELFFSIKAVKEKHDSMALGDILGTVITDATIVVGIVALIQPFYFESRIVHVTGIFMLAATLCVFDFMKSDKRITKREGIYLLLFYLFFIGVEMLYYT